MIDYTAVYNLVKDIHQQYSSDTFTLYKPDEVEHDIYREGTTTWQEGIELVGIVRTQPDQDKITILGQAEKDQIFITVSRKECDEKMTGVTENHITTKDVLVFEGLKYSIDEVKRTARVGGDYTMYTLCARENPDIEIA